MKIKLDAVGIFVENLKKMVEFYRNVLGLETAWDGEPYAEFKHNGLRLMMYGREDLEKLIGKELSYPSGLNGSFELAIDLPRFEDVDVEFKRIVDLGAIPVFASSFFIINPLTNKKSDSKLFI